MEILNTIVEILPTVLVLVIFAIAGIFYFKNEKDKMQEWLIWAVSQAETYLGSGTGKLKLRYAYDLFIEKFPVFSTLIPFTTFEMWVDDALKYMDKMISTNPDIKDIIEGITEE